MNSCSVVDGSFCRYSYYILICKLDFRWEETFFERKLFILFNFVVLNLTSIELCPMWVQFETATFCFQNQTCEVIFCKIWFYLNIKNHKLINNNVFYPIKYSECLSNLFLSIVFINLRSNCKSKTIFYKFWTG